MAIFFLRLLAIWAAQNPMTLYYGDSTSHILFRTWRFAGVLAGETASLFSMGALYAVFGRLGLNLFWSSFAAQAALAGCAVLCFYDATRRLSSPAVAALAAAFAVSVPAFGRLVFSGQPEILALALVVSAYWLAVAGLRTSDKSRWLLDIMALGLLGFSMKVRSECGGFLLIYALISLWSWRRSRVRAALCGLWAAAWIAGSAFRLGAHSMIAFTDNNIWTTDGFFANFTRLPKRVVSDFFPVNVVGLAAVSIWLRGKAAAPLGILLAVAAAQAALLWMASFAYLVAPEMERNLCAVFFLAMAPGAAALAEWFRDKRLFVRSAAFLIPILVGMSWWFTVREKPALTPAVWRSRLVGLEISRLVKTGEVDLKEGKFLLEAVDHTWPNAIVFSDAQDRIRLFPSQPVDWGSSRIWDGKEAVVAAAITSDLKPRLGLKFGPLRSKVDLYGIYPVEPR